MSESERNHIADISLQDRVRENPNDCDHIGFFTPLGHKAFSMEKGQYIVNTSVLCMMCGNQFHSITHMSDKEKSS